MEFSPITVPIPNPSPSPPCDLPKSTTFHFFYDDDDEFGNLFLFVAAVMAFVGVAIHNRFYISECAWRKFRRTVTVELISEKPNPISSKSFPLAVGRMRFFISS
ncbi:hypothetical protein L195_g045396 [Trifolium pratense]|uniref:Uncharacterized protein n=1 Tax=Trifolium pratense TaxID=57577 RepID=A0A2K3MER5_TRIPR|nr:hypothetical protein L195_g045396 [Trifolium pratense]